MVASSGAGTIGMVQAVLWIWVHLLQFNVSNQTIHVEEDAHNKDYRPLPSGRISLYAATLLRWLLIPVCWTISIRMGSKPLFSSIALSLLTIIHNELGGHARSWILRNILNGLGLASFEMGAISVICMFYLRCLISSHPIYILFRRKVRI